MANKNLLCPRCMNLIRKNEDKCSQCGMTRAEIEGTRVPREELPKSEQPEVKDEGGVVVDTKAALEPSAAGDKSAKSEHEQASESKSGAQAQEGEQADAQPKQAQGNSFAEPDRLQVSPSYDEGIDSRDIGAAVMPDEAARKRHKHKAKQKDAPQYTVDENGEYNIDTHDVTYLEDIETPTHSVKKARGEVKQEKLKWWEIYKWADRMLARRKINKEVNKAARKIPVGIKKGPALALCLFFGYIGAHNFYTKNYKRAWFMLISFLIIIPVVTVPVLTEFMGVFVGGGLGFIILTMWVMDLFGLITNRYRYRISKEEFISNLNVETRAKLGNKYIALDRSVFKAKEEKRLAKYNKKKLKKNEKR